MRQPRGTGEVTWNGYLRVVRRGHPLADRRGRVLYHRALLWDTLGPGPHPCIYCGAPVRFDQTDQDAPDYATCEHRDGNRLNNDPNNLAPCCWPCNRERQGSPGEHRRWGA